MSCEREEILDKINSIELANDIDWSAEYLDKIVSIKTIKGGVEEAVNHINKYGSGHTDAILDDEAVVDYFLNNVDSGIVMHNTSTQFADGGSLEWAPKLEYQHLKFMPEAQLE